MNRRRFLTQSATGMLTAAAACVSGRQAFAALNAVRPGLQLYSVHGQLPADFGGTLNQIGAIGFQEVEAAGLYGHSPAQVRAAMSTAGLQLVSAHVAFDDLQNRLDETLATQQALGVGFVVCSSPGFQDPARAAGLSYRDRMNSFTLADFRWTAERLNVWGKAAQAKGLRLAYHNYTVEFIPRDGVVPYAEMLRLTDSALVSFELDWGWAVIGGAEPSAYLQRYPQRFPLLHIKDFAPARAPVTPLDPPPPTELGKGTVNFTEIAQAIQGAAVQHIFAEQEGYDMPVMEALRSDAAYLRRRHL